MTAKRKIISNYELTIEEFLAFTETRPKEERWQLIKGEPVLSPSPVDYHQIVVTNIAAVLWNTKIANNASWFVLTGTGTKSPASVRSLLQPDVMVKQLPPTGSAVSADCLVAFEILSRSNPKADQAWRRKFYSDVPNCAHYVTVSLKARHVALHSRDANWVAQNVRAASDHVALAAIEATLTLADIYQYTLHAVR